MDGPVRCNSQSRPFVTWLCGLFFVVGVLIAGQVSDACPFCDTPSITFSEQVAQSQAVVLVKWAGAEKPDPFNFEPGSCTYQIVSRYRQNEATPQPGEQVTIPFYQSGKPGDSFWMLGTETDGKLNWAPPVSMSKECWEYVTHAPDRKAEPGTRLRYYLKHLEHADSEIAIDAYGEFAGANYADLLQLTKELPREKLLEWLLNPETVPSRRGLYGLMLGLCGTPEDAARIEPILLENPEGARLGVDGMMAGYVLINGAPGLQKLVDSKLKNRDANPSESFAVLQMLRFLGEYATHAVPRDQLLAAMRTLLDHPQYASFAAIDLARWSDWGATKLLVERYGSEPFGDSEGKQAVIRFLTQAAAVSDEQAGMSLEDVKLARESLAKYRQTDPEIVRIVERLRFD